MRDRVEFNGRWVPIEELLDAIAAADGGIVAMKRDPFRDLVHCNKMYDLVAMRRPVITSRTRSVEAYFSDDAFLWFTAEDPDDLARAIRRLYADPGLGDRLVQQAEAEVEPYRWPRQREQYKRYVLSAATRRHAGGRRRRVGAVVALAGRAARDHDAELARIDVREQAQGAAARVARRSAEVSDQHDAVDEVRERDRVVDCAERRHVHEHDVRHRARVLDHVGHHRPREQRLGVGRHGTRRQDVERARPRRSRFRPRA